MLVALSVMILDKWSFVMLHSCSMFSKNLKMVSALRQKDFNYHLERGNAL